MTKSITKDNTIFTLAFLVTGFPPDVSGVSHYNWERAQWFAKQGMYRVVVFAPDWQQPHLDSSMEVPGLDKLIIERYPSKPWTPSPVTHVPKFFASNYINRKLANYQPDIVIVTDTERFFLLSTWQLPGKDYVKEHNIPFIAEYHTDLYNFSAAYPGWQWLRFLAHKTQMTSYLYRQFDMTICASHAANKSCREMGISNVKTMPFSGIDVSSYSPNYRNRQCLEQWLNPEERNNKILLFLGRLAFEKRVDLLVKAFIKLKQRKLKYSLIIAGDGPVNAVNQLKNLAQEVPHIHFTGFVLGEAKAKLLASCDVFCSPSPYETFGRTIVEAMASGIPVITVNSGAVTDYILDGVNGYLVSPNDIEALANCIHKVLSGNNTEIIQRALQDAQQFSLEQSCQNLHNYYQQILNKDKVGSKQCILNTRYLKKSQS